LNQRGFSTVEFSYSADAKNMAANTPNNSTPIQPRASAPGQDPLINPGYQPVPQELRSESELEQLKPMTIPVHHETIHQKWQREHDIVWVDGMRTATEALVDIRADEPTKAFLEDKFNVIDGVSCEFHHREQTELDPGPVLTLHADITDLGLPQVIWNVDQELTGLGFTKIE
jgi:hypothetical protein